MAVALAAMIAAILSIVGGGGQVSIVGLTVCGVSTRVMTGGVDDRDALHSGFNRHEQALHKHDGKHQLDNGR